MKHKMMSSLLLRLVSIVLVIGMLTMGMASSVVAADGSPAITTDKTKYTLGETMVISGIGFTPEGTVNIEVQLPGNNGIDTLPPVSTDAVGSFQTSYTPPIIPGRYKITATDGIDTAKTAATEADAVNFDLIAFGVKTDSGGTVVTEIGWGRGNSDKGWREGDWVPVKLVMTGVQSSYPNLVGFPDIYIGFDFTANSDCRFVDLVRGIQVGTTDLDDEHGWPQASGAPYPTGMVPPNPPNDLPTLAAVHTAQTSVGENTWTGFTLITDQCLVNYPYGPTDSTYGPRPGAVDDGKHQFVIDADVITGIVSPTASTIVVYFQAHLSRTFVWLHSLQSEYNTSPTNDWGGSLYGDPIYATDKREGSSFAPGSSGHMYVNMVGQGQITCQLPIPPKPAGVISGLKWHDLNANHVMDPGEPELSGWTMRISGTDPEGLTFSIDVLTGDTDGDGIVDDVNSGAYSFPDLTEGTWYIGEMTDRDVPPSTGWQQTYPYQVVSIGVAVSAPTSGFPAEFPPAGIAGWGWNVTITETNISQSGLNFGNMNVGCLEITKQLSIPGGVPLGPLDGTFTINVANAAAGYSQNVTFTMTNGVITSTNPVTLSGLTPGNYTLTEPGLPSYWAPTAGLGIVTVGSGASCAARTVTNTYTPGCLTITKNLVTTGYLFANNITMDFIVNVANAGIGYSQNITFHVVNGVLQAPTSVTLENLIPGTYNVTEVNPGIMWTVTGEGIVTVNSGTPCAAKTITNTIKLPNTSINITADVYETTPGGNVWLYIWDTNDGQVPLTDPHVHLLIDGVEFDANNVTPGIQPLTKGDAYWSSGPPTWPQIPGAANGDAGNDGIMGVGETWYWAVQVTISADTEFIVNGHGTDPLGNPVDGPTYASEVGTITVEVGGATRTWGFWKTHLFLVNWMLDPAGGNISLPIYLGTWASYNGTPVVHAITNNCTYMGLMWSDQSKNFDRTMRNNIDAARIHAAHQALAAIMNSLMPGGASLPAGITLASINATLSSDNITAIRNLGSALAGYNESGDDVALDPSMPPTGKVSGNIADPQGARGAATETCYRFWDSPPAPKGKNK